MYEFQGADLLRCETLFVKLNQILYKFNFSTTFYFSVLSFLEIIFILYAFKNEEVNFFVGFILFYILYIFNYVNISRQCIAMNICLCSYYFFYEKKYLKWLFFVLLASGFHIGSFSLIIFVPVLNWLSRRKIPDFIYYFLFIISFLMFERLYVIIMEGVLLPFNLLTNGRYKIVEKLLTYKITLGSGMGVRLKILGYLLMLPALLYDKNNNQKTRFYFAIYFFGVFGELIASLNMNLQRLFMFYSPIQVLLISRRITFINKDNILGIRNLLFLFGFFIIVILFLSNSIKGINNTSFYKWCL